MPKKKKILRPAASPQNVSDSPSRTIAGLVLGATVSGDHVASAADGDSYEVEECDVADEGFNVAASRYAALLTEREELEERLKKSKKTMANLEEYLLEEMAGNAIQSVNIGGRTLYRKSDLVVGKAKGIDTADVVRVFGLIGWESMKTVGYNANTLKASLKELIRNAESKEHSGEQFYCEASDTFFDSDAVRAGAFGDPPCCPETGEPILLVIDGIPKVLHELLYIEEKFKLGHRKS